jgi:hypothetical protein
MKILLCFSLFLVGCSSSSELFDSEPGKGAGNKSITEVNHMINQGVFKEDQNLRVWIAPFYDENGDFHEASYMQTDLSKEVS